MTEVSMPQIALVILSYDSFREATRLARMLAPVLQPRDLLVLVDNASPGREGREEWLACAAPNVLCLELSQNGGYSRGNNAGIDAALAKGIENVVVLNPDIDVDSPPTLIEGIRRHFKEDDFLCLGLEVHGVPPYATPVTLASLLFPIYCRARDRVCGARPSAAPGLVEVGRIHGCGFALRAGPFRKLGLFDSDVFLYGEEAIVSIVAGRAGLKVLQSTQVSVRHAGAKANGVNWFALRNERRSLAYVFGKYFGIPRWMGEAMAWVPISQAVCLQVAAPIWRGLRRGWRGRSA